MEDLRRGPWTVEEDFTLINYIAHHGEGRWNSLSRCAGLKRTGKSCRLRWLNYLRPDVRRGNITLEEQLLILELHSRWGNRWSKIAQHLPGRTDNEIKNYWRTRVQKHAKQLKCDVNSKQFKDTMRYLWMPRLVERIQSQSQSQATGTPASAATTYNVVINTHQNADIINLDMGSAQISSVPQPHDVTNIIRGGGGGSLENSSAAVSSDSFGTPVSDMTTDCYNNYVVPLNHDLNQDYYPPAAAAANNNNINYHHHHQHLSSYNYDDDQSNNLTSPSGYFNQAGGMDFVDHQNSQWNMDGGDVSDNIWNVDDMWFLQP
ncbi:hypothetical protein MIMGU_mgv1a010262mg [Erythranthe guttata]|uniref:Uncharacterized protein n=2 Tax=Erythranthe guttata TaxID=4155 RepID=A0A022QWP0_ERYGU|nr:hypothetical protein MIMGU_mgv1a010262mg [Erythranthe guttata]